MCIILSISVDECEGVSVGSELIVERRGKKRDVNMPGRNCCFNHCGSCESDEHKDLGIRSIHIPTLTGTGHLFVNLRDLDPMTYFLNGP